MSAIWFLWQRLHIVSAQHNYRIDWYSSWSNICLENVHSYNVHCTLYTVIVYNLNERCFVPFSAVASIKRKWSERNPSKWTTTTAIIMIACARNWTTNSKYSLEENGYQSLSVFAYLIRVFCSINDTRNETIELKCINRYSMRAHQHTYTSIHCIQCILCSVHSHLEQDIEHERCSISNLFRTVKM